MKKNTKKSYKILLANIIVVVIFGLVSVILLRYFKTSTEWITVTFKITDDNPLYATTYPSFEFAKNYKVGEAQNNELGIKEAEIIKVDSYQSSVDQFVVYVDINLKASYDKRLGMYKFKGKPLVFGETQTFTFPSVRFEGLVVFSPNSDRLEETSELIRVQGQLNYSRISFSETDGVPEYIADQIVEGKVMTDSENNVLVRIVKVEKTPAERMVVTNDGKLILQKDPKLIDVKMTLDIKVKNMNGLLYYFDYKPLLVGSVISVDLKDVYIWPTVTKIEGPIQ